MTRNLLSCAVHLSGNEDKAVLTYDGSEREFRAFQPTSKKVT